MHLTHNELLIIAAAWIISLYVARTVGLNKRLSAEKSRGWLEGYGFAQDMLQPRRDEKGRFKCKHTQEVNQQSNKGKPYSESTTTDFFASTSDAAKEKPSTCLQATSEGAGASTTHGQKSESRSKLTEVSIQGDDTLGLQEY